MTTLKVSNQSKNIGYQPLEKKFHIITVSHPGAPFAEDIMLSNANPGDIIFLPYSQGLRANTGDVCILQRHFKAVNGPMTVAAICVFQDRSVGHVNNPPAGWTSENWRKKCHFLGTDKPTVLQFKVVVVRDARFTQLAGTLPRRYGPFRHADGGCPLLWIILSGNSAGAAATGRGLVGNVVPHTVTKPTNTFFKKFNDQRLSLTSAVIQINM